MNNIDIVATNRAIMRFSAAKESLLGWKEELTRICKQCVSEGTAECKAGGDNHCEIRSSLIRITKALEGTT